MDLSHALQAKPTSERRRAEALSHRMVGSRCSACSTSVWPSRAVCAACGSAELAEEAFQRDGQLVTYTTVHVARPGLAVPYTLGQVRLDDGGPLVFGQVVGLPEGATVPVAVRSVIGAEGDSPWYHFEYVG